MLALSFIIVAADAGLLACHRIAKKRKPRVYLVLACTAHAKRVGRVSGYVR